MTTSVAVKPMDKLKQALSAESVQQQFHNAMGDHADLFIASIIDLYGAEKSLQGCDANLVIAECLKAATLKLPLNKQLGFAYVWAYKIQGIPTPQFAIGYKGLIQLGLRTGEYKYLNANRLHEGYDVREDILTGEVTIKGQKKSDKVIGYFAYLQLLNGFSKTKYMTVEEIHAHGKKYAPSYNNPKGKWQTDFDSMAMKTPLRLLLMHWGYLSIEMISVLKGDADFEAEFAEEIDENANKTPLEIPEGKKPKADADGVIIDEPEQQKPEPDDLTEWFE